MTAPDAIVVGAGIAGTATAWFLRAAGMRVVLLDAHEPGWGASGRNPGFLWLQTKAAGQSMQFSLRARRFAGDFAATRGDPTFRACGGLVLFRDDACLPVARAFVEDRRAAGLPVDLLDRAGVAALVPEIGPQVSGGVWNPLDAHQDTAGFLRRLAADFAAAGGTVMVPARVAALDMAGGRCRGVVLADGRVLHAGVTVLAAGPWANDLLASVDLRIPFRPMRFEAAATAPAPFRIGPVCAGQALFRFFTPQGVDPAGLPADPSQSLTPGLGFTEQIASMPDGSVQFGCAYEHDSMDDRPSVAGTAMACTILSRNIPALAGVPLDRIWGGIVMQTADGLPVIDAAPGIAGLALNLGHFFGNLAGGYSGSLLADALCGAAPAESLAPFARNRLI